MLLKMLKFRVRQKLKLVFLFSLNKIFFLAQHFVDDAIKATEDYTMEGVKQGQKLTEQAFELGKDKGYLYRYFQ